MIDKPPPVLSNGRVLEYAIVDESVTYSGHSSLFVGSAEGGWKELGPVPCLAIIKELSTGEIMLLHCDDVWDQLGVSANFQSVEEAKARAERAYHGISSRWIDPKVTEEEALKYREEVWGDDKCSFCDKIPPNFEMMVRGRNVRICDSCIEEFRKMVEEQRQKK
jgi:hypothetical protein